MTGSSCRLCDGACAGADLDPLIVPDLLWLWSQLADAADRRGDPRLVDGPDVGLRAPGGPDERAAATGLLGARLRPGQFRKVPLAALTERLRRRGPRLTPGAVAAHGVNRQLAGRARERLAHEENVQALLDRLAVALSANGGWLATVHQDSLLPAFRRSKAFVLLTRADDPATLIDSAARVLTALPPPGEQIDRRLLSNATLGHPHGLDDGHPVASIVRALLSAAGAVPPRLRPRDTWRAVGVLGDELTGGLSTIGIYPAGWRLPAGATVTLPPLELTEPRWPEPDEPSSWVFVTENPSVLTSARELAASGARPRLICTSGTPSALENAAVGALADAGWRVAVRADFDEAGLRHVAALLNAAPSAVPWRMSADHYLAAVDPDGAAFERPGELQSPWDRDLARAMMDTDRLVFEEALLPDLLDDLRSGAPPNTSQVPG